MKIYKLVISSIAIALFYNVNLLFSDLSEQDVLNEIFCQTIFDTKRIIENKMYILAFNSIYIIILFHIFLGRYIEKELSQHGPYIFSRIDSREKWFLLKSVNLLVFSIIYTFTYLMSTLLICMISIKQISNIETIVVFFYLWFSLTIITFLTTLLINYISIFYREQISFLAVYIMMIFLIFASINTTNSGLFADKPLLNYINPVALMSLYSLDSLSIKALIVFLYTVFCFICIFLMSKKINKIDISTNIKK